LRGWLLAVWAVVLVLTSRSVRRRPKRRAKNSEEYQRPKIDLALMAIAALTIYMAIRSRRFIPIAAIAACPVIAMFIDQMICAISATRNLHKQNHLCVSSMPQFLQLFFIFAGAAAVLTFGTWWGLKFKYVYLDAWPNDQKLNSVFMRMTASDAKPFYACKFIKDNKLAGKMFNYWTEGGFIGYGQQPDPNTGKTPLQLFMDGRAQAAYEPKAYEVWTKIMSGGPIVHNARIRRHKLTAADYTKVGQWIGEQLKKYDVWVVLMPAGQFNKPFVRGLERNPNWHLVFFNNRQRLFINSTTPQGKQLFEGMFDNKIIYPDDFSRNLIIAHNMLLFGKDSAVKKQGLDFAVKAFRLNPSALAMQKILSAARLAELRPTINKFCENYLDDFATNENHYLKQDGYRNRIVAALFASDYLKKIAEGQKNAELAKLYSDKKKEYNKVLKQAGKGKRW
jgi:hypothetical protein